MRASWQRFSTCVARVSHAVITAAGFGRAASHSFSAARSSRDPAAPGERNTTGSALRSLSSSVKPLSRESLQYWRDVVGTNPYARCAPKDTRYLAPMRPIWSSSLRVKAIPFRRVERTGPGSPMNDTGIFESRTSAAVSSGPGSLAMMPSSPTALSARNASGVNSLGIWKSRVCQLGCIRVKWNTPERMSRPADPDILRTIATLLMRFIAEKNTIILARKSTKDATPHYGPLTVCALILYTSHRSEQICSAR